MTGPESYRVTQQSWHFEMPLEAGVPLWRHMGAERLRYLVESSFQAAFPRAGIVYSDRSSSPMVGHSAWRLIDVGSGSLVVRLFDESAYVGITIDHGEVDIGFNISGFKGQLVQIFRSITIETDDFHAVSPKCDQIAGL